MDCMVPDGFLYAGMPKFRALFGRDSIISAMALLDLDSTIAQLLADAQTLYKYYGTGMINFQGHGGDLFEIAQQQNFISGSFRMEATRWYSTHLQIYTQWSSYTT